MESVVLLGLMGAGYLMNKDKDDKHKAYNEVQPPLQNGSEIQYMIKLIIWIQKIMK